MLSIVSQRVHKPKFVLLVLADDPYNKVPDRIATIPQYVADGPDCRTYRGTVTGYYAMSKVFNSPEQCMRWLNRNIPNLEFKVYSYQIVPVEEMDTWQNNRGLGQYMERDFPFQWQRIDDVKNNKSTT